MGSTLSSGWFTCKQCSCTAPYEGGAADQMINHCAFKECPKHQVPPAPRELSEEDKKRNELFRTVGDSVAAELMARFKRAACGGS